MKSPRLAFILLLLLASRVWAAEPKVNVYLRFYELSGDAALAKRGAKLRAGPKTVELVMPPFQIESGKSGEASVERVFEGPRQGGPKVGVHLTIRPKLKGERIRYSVDSKRVEFVGHRPGTRGVFAIGKISGMSGSCKYGQPVQLDLGIRKETRSVTDEDSGRTEVVAIRRRFVAMLIFTRV